MDAILEEGVVVETHEKTAVIRINKSSACAHCKSGCMERGGVMMAEAENSIGAQAGDTVRLEFNSRAALTAMLVVFGLPLLALLIGVILTSAIADRMGYQNRSQPLGIAVGMVLFFLTFIPIRVYDRHIKKTGTCNAIVIEVLKRADA